MIGQEDILNIIPTIFHCNYNCNFRDVFIFCILANRTQEMPVVAMCKYELLQRTFSTLVRCNKSCGLAVLVEDL